VDLGKRRNATSGDPEQHLIAQQIDWDEGYIRQPPGTFQYGNIRVKDDAAFRAFLKGELSNDVLQEGARGGRPPEYVWDEVWTHICLRIAKDYRPATLSKLVSDIQQFYLDRFGKEPADSLVKQKFRKLFKGLSSLNES
jgi:hypothetical protein